MPATCPACLWNVTSPFFSFSSPSVMISSSTSDQDFDERPDQPRTMASAVRWSVAVIVCVALGIIFAPEALGNTWTNLNPTAQANRRDSHNVAYDSTHNRVILYGGHASYFPACASCYTDTWAYDCSTNTWRNMNPATNPGPRAEFGMAYDSQHDRVILFGGDASSWPGGTPGPAQTNDTWAYSFATNTWTNLTPSMRPPPVNNCRLAYDSESDRMITIAAGTTWAYNYTANSWQNMGVAGGPTNGFGVGMTYDSVHDRVIVIDRSMRTWAYDYNTNRWQRRATTGPAPAPPTANGWVAWLAYDRESDKTIYYNDDQITWVYDWTSDALTNMGATPSPVAHHHAMVYLEQHDRVFFYGGMGQNQTWFYDYNSRPGAMVSSALLMLTRSRGLLIFGGRRSPRYAIDFRRQMVKLVRAGRTPGELAREFEPSAQAIRICFEKARCFWLTCRYSPATFRKELI